MITHGLGRITPFPSLAAVQPKNDMERNEFKTNLDTQALVYPVHVAQQLAAEVSLVHLKALCVQLVWL